MKNNKTIPEYVSQYPEQVQDMIDDIMDNFDFEKVQKVMNFLNWTWVQEEGAVVPAVSQIRKFARILLKNVTFKVTTLKQHAATCCGGLKAECQVYDFYPEEDEEEIDDAAHQLGISLVFELEEYTGFF